MHKTHFLHQSVMISLHLAQQKLSRAFCTIFMFSRCPPKIPSWITTRILRTLLQNYQLLPPSYTLRVFDDKLRSRWIELCLPQYGFNYGEYQRSSCSPDLRSSSFHRFTISFQVFTFLSYQKIWRPKCKYIVILRTSTSLKSNAYTLLDMVSQIYINFSKTSHHATGLSSLFLNCNNHLSQANSLHNSKLHSWRNCSSLIASNPLRMTQ